MKNISNKRSTGRSQSIKLCMKGYYAYHIKFQYYSLFIQYNLVECYSYNNLQSFKKSFFWSVFLISTFCLGLPTVQIYRDSCRLETLGSDVPIKPQFLLQYKNKSAAFQSTINSFRHDIVVYAGCFF